MANVTISQLNPVTSLGPLVNIPVMSGPSPATRITVRDLLANVIAPNIYLGDYSNLIGNFIRAEPGNNQSNITGFGATLQGNVIVANIIPARLGTNDEDPVWPTLGSPTAPFGAIYSTTGVVVGANPASAASGIDISPSSTDTGVASFFDQSSGQLAGISAGDITSDVITANSAVLSGLLRSGSIITGNITSNANISATGNITANYFLGNAAFLTGLPQNYGNSDVANYLASNSNVEITVGISNIATQGNITGAYFLGNGAFLTGITASGGNAGPNITQYSGAVNTFNPIASTAEISAVLPVGAVPNLGDFFVDTSTRVNNQQPIYVFVNSQWRQLLTALG